MGEKAANRTNISLPRDLKARMDAVKESVNWSAIAAEAFEAKLLQLQSQKEVKGMDDVVARLKAAAELEANEDYQAGLEAGRQWAKEEATPKQLRRIGDYIDSYATNYSFSWWDIDFPGWNAPFGALDQFVFAVWPDRKEDREASDDFWRQALGDDAHRINDCDYFHGFGEGAVEVWNEVAHKL
jgi:hypothetical protein